MYVISTNTAKWITGTNTEVRVEFDDEAKTEAERWNGPGEDMLSKCFWRLLHERWSEVHGPLVTFAVNKGDVLGLVERLRIANAESLN